LRHNFDIGTSAQRTNAAIIQYMTAMLGAKVDGPPTATAPPLEAIVQPCHEYKKPPE
jgi:hypothetical protein